MQISVSNKPTIQDLIAYITYTIGLIDSHLDTVTDQNTDAEVGICYDYGSNSIIVMFSPDCYTVTKSQIMSLYRPKQPIVKQAKRLAAKFYGCYVANDRQRAANDAPTMIVDYRNNR